MTSEAAGGDAATPRIRIPLASEAEVIADLHVETWRQTYGHLLPEGFFTTEHTAHRRRMWDRLVTEQSAMTVRVTEVDGGIVGFTIAGPAERHDDASAPRDLQLYAIYVDAAHHGSGAGHALLNEAIGDKPALLWVAKENPRAVEFYRRHGFNFDGVEQVDPHTPNITEARMVR